MPDKFARGLFDRTFEGDRILGYRPVGITHLFRVLPGHRPVLVVPNLQEQPQAGFSPMLGIRLPVFAGKARIISVSRFLTVKQPQLPVHFGILLME